MITVGNNCELNLERLIATRMLINANSGGGKSWAIRRLLEQSHGQVQQIVIDLEGEFASLREKFDYLLVGKDGEIHANIRTAEILSRRILELNVSTIIDLSELKHPERITFVKRFLDSLINSPKELWHPVLVIVDEAHQFCPESSKSESASAVIDLMTRGRKRGFCGILATQRISKLSKDAIAEANNYLTGRTSLDIDMKRASEILGFVNKDDMRSLRDLKAGEFLVFGSAFNHNGVQKITVGNIQTTHPDKTKGIDIIKPTKTPDNIKKLLKEVIDLPKEAEEELRTTQDMKNKIRELKTRLTIAEKSQKVQEKTINITDEKALQKAKDEGFKEAERFYKSYINPIEQNTKLIRNSISKLVKDAQNLLESKAFIMVSDIPPPKLNPVNIKSTLKSEVKIIDKKNYNYPPEIKTQRFAQGLDSSQPLRAGAIKMLNWLAGAHPKELSKQRLATLSGFSVKGGTFNTYISELKRNGWIVGSNDFSITEEGLNNATPEAIPNGAELIELWKKRFRDGVGKILQYLYEQFPNTVTKEEIGSAVGFEPSGGTFNTYISELRRNRLIIIDNSNIKISEEFFE
jgi:hypothetical protein